mgnify:CR=1 FL=1
MKANITEYLRVNLDTEMWECRNCDNELISAHENYKRGLLVHDRNPSEIHKPLIDPELYSYSFAPDPVYTAMLEFYCPHCGTMVEVASWGDIPERPEIPDTARERSAHHH